MKSKLYIQNPDQIEFKLEMTMTLADWKSLQKQLTSNYPSWQLSTQINSMIHQASKSFTPQTEEPQ